MYKDDDEMGFKSLPAFNMDMLKVPIACVFKNYWTQLT
jgi:hypothetical protein